MADKKDAPNQQPPRPSKDDFVKNNDRNIGDSNTVSYDRPPPDKKK